MATLETVLAFLMIPLAALAVIIFIERRTKHDH
jgi:hypothetical protein